MPLAGFAMTARVTSDSMSVKIFFIVKLFGELKMIYRGIPLFIPFDFVSRKSEK